MIFLKSFYSIIFRLFLPFVNLIFYMIYDFLYSVALLNF